jgi:hypothetical protein
MLYLDAFSAHLTPTIRSHIRKNRIALSIVLGGYTRYVQVLDVSLNKPLKELIKEEHDDYYDQHIDDWEWGVFSIGERNSLGCKSLEETSLGV